MSGSRRVFSSSADVPITEVIENKRWRSELSKFAAVCLAKAYQELCEECPNCHADRNFRKARQAARQAVAQKFGIDSNFLEINNTRQRYRKEANEFKFACMVVAEALGIER